VKQSDWEMESVIVCVRDWKGVWEGVLSGVLVKSRRLYF